MPETRNLPTANCSIRKKLLFHLALKKPDADQGVGYAVHRLTTISGIEPGRIVSVICKLRAISLVGFFMLVGASSGRADSIIGYFNLSCPSGGCYSPYNGPIQPVAPGGEIILTLNTNGTIDATLDSYGLPINTFGLRDYMSPPLLLSGYSPTAPTYPEASIQDDFGFQNIGFYCPDCGTTESWMIGTPGEFTSVWQLLNNTDSSVDFFLLTQGTGVNVSWGADAQPYSPISSTPEPGSFVLLGTGVLGVLGAIRRKLAGSSRA